ncbi:MAG TPA: serine hydrolase [Leptospiraceae bacterium]|nr:serine hydrolase [Leptospiraceae bacterium]HMY67756.1 serine hydrolase [Leptospiraceae bacterium]HNF16404.1 serine hydrolase [Leptospiraceae bacterium]HNI99420.1 serine hydrolase [Leptospiraceae bacterium]HNM03167.1 serine hydrolase [Leptospiraceae bacterium]
MKKYFAGIAVLCLTAGSSVFLARHRISPLTLLKALPYWNSPSEVHRIFPERKIEKSRNPFIFERKETEIDPEVGWREGGKIRFSEFLKETNTLAFLLAKDGTILQEKYFKGKTEESVFPSYSIAKSIVSLLFGTVMINDRKIFSEEDFAWKYIPEYKNLKGIRMHDFLNMTSGIIFQENYLSVLSDFYLFSLSSDLGNRLHSYSAPLKPGMIFEYRSVNTFIIGLIIERVTNQRLSVLLQERIWKKIGTEWDAGWSLDREDGLEKSYCCLNARARDFLKIGRLVLQNGKWENAEIIPKKWMDKLNHIETVEPDTKFGYNRQWWYPGTDPNMICGIGIHGQYLCINRSKKLIFVKFSEHEAEADEKLTLQAFEKISETLTEN